MGEVAKAVLFQHKRSTRERQMTCLYARPLARVDSTNSVTLCVLVLTPRPNVAAQNTACTVNARGHVCVCQYMARSSRSSSSGGLNGMYTAAVPRLWLRQVSSISSLLRSWRVFSWSCRPPCVV